MSILLSYICLQKQAEFALALSLSAATEYLQMSGMWSEKTYKANFGDREMFVGDITQMHEDDIPDHDVLLAGFPCQPFSIAGVSKNNSLGRDHGFAHATQGTLFFDVARIIAAKRPKAFLLENVKNLVSHDTRF